MAWLAGRSGGMAWQCPKRCFVIVLTCISDPLTALAVIIDKYIKPMFKCVQIMCAKIMSLGKCF